MWQATTIDEYSRIRAANVGTTAATWGYNSATNLLSQIKGTGVQQYDYVFDGATGNLNSRTNYLKSKTESFGYDTGNLDRLASVTGVSAQTLTYQSGNKGNILTKSDAGTYSYDAEQKYAVDGITNARNISTTTQDIGYTAFDKVETITEGTKTAEFVYNADRQRIRMVLKTGGTVTKTRWYFGGSCEREQVGSTVTQYIWIGGDAYTAVAVAKKVGSGSWTVYNIFRDHLGTITHLKSGGTTNEYSFDAWGRRRDKDTWSYTLSSEPAVFADRGFTAHEYLEDFKLYNMNGRLYDPVVGRFLSPDNYVQMPGFTQSYNRYSYCLNNPLIYTDPSGNSFLGLLFRAIAGNYLMGVADNWINKDMPISDAFKATPIVAGTNFSPGNFTQQYNYGFSNPQVDAHNLVGYEKEYYKKLNQFVSSQSGRRSLVEDIWNSRYVRAKIPDFISVGIGFSGIAGAGGNSSVELRWVTRGPETSLRPAVTTTQSVGGGYQIDAMINFEGANYFGDVKDIRRQMMQTNSAEGQFPTIWGSGGFTAGGKIGVTGYLTPNVAGSVIIGRELNIGVGLPAGPFPVNGAGGVSNTWILYDFYYK